MSWGDVPFVWVQFTPGSRRLPESFEQVARDALDAWVRALGGGVNRRPHIARGLRQAVSPPDGGGVEHKVAPGPGVDCGGVLAFATRALGDAARDDLKARYRRRVS